MSTGSAQAPRLRAPRSAVELVFPPGAPQPAGAARSEANEPANETGGPRRLPIGPRRWLLIDGPDLPGDSGALRFDVTGKWQALELPIDDGESALRAEIDLERTLGDRGCGVSSLRGAPVVIARTPATIEVWTTSSYVAWLADALGRNGDRPAA